MSFIQIILLAVGLSMDAFSLALIYGTLNMEKKMNNWMSIMVGIFHLFMPIIGYTLGKFILNFLPINPDVLVGVIFIVLALEMLISLKKEEQVKILTNFLSVCLFAFTVSIDSLSIGIAFGAIKESIIFPSVIFSITSAFFTYIGVNLGNQLVKRFGKIATIMGSFILLLLGIQYLF